MKEAEEKVVQVARVPQGEEEQGSGVSPRQQAASTSTSHAVTIVWAAAAEFKALTSLSAAELLHSLPPQLVLHCALSPWW